MKRTSKTDKHRFQRKRARRKVQVEEEEKAPPVSDAMIQKVKSFLERVSVPRIWAQEARRLGDPGVSPRDYYCGCPQGRADWLPLCEGRKP